MDTWQILILLYAVVGGLMAYSAVDYALDKPREWHYWPKFVAIMVVAWPMFLWTIRNN